MKKTAAVVAVLCMLLSAATLAKTGVGGTSVGQWSGGAHLGYSFGLSGFGDYGGGYWGGEKWDWSYKPTFAFDVCGQYQWKKNLAIGAEIYIQSTKIDTPSGWGGDAGSFTNILALGVYEFNPGKPSSMLLLVGAGLYEDDFGANGGIGYRKFINPKLAMVGGGRVHFVMSDPTFAWLHLFFGLQYFFGN